MKKESFTLIEMIVVLGVLVLAIPSLFAIIFVILNQQAKIYRLSEVKRQGDYALSIIESTVRNNAEAVYSDSGLTTKQCFDTGSNTTYQGPTLYLKDRYGAWFSYSGAGTIASSSSNLASAINLTSDSTTISNFVMSCTKSGDFSPPVIYIGFDIGWTQGAGITPRPQESATMSYQTRIKLRTF